MVEGWTSGEKKKAARREGGRLFLKGDLD